MEQKTMTVAEYKASVRKARKVFIVTANFAIDQAGQAKRRTVKISKRAAIRMLDSVSVGSVIVAQWADDEWQQCLIVG